MTTKNSSDTRGDSSGTSATSSHHPEGKHGERGSRIVSTRTSMNTPHVTLARKALRKALIEAYGEGICEDWRMNRLFEKNDLDAV